MKKIERSNGIIFGSTGVLGSKISLELAKMDSNLILHGKSLKKLKQLDDQIKKLNKKVTLLPADVTDKEFSKNLLKQVSSRFCKIDFVINLIGVFMGLRPLTNFSHKEWDNLLEINLSSSWRIIRELEPLIRKSDNGKVIFLSNKNISSGQAYYNTVSIFQNAQETMLKIFKQENLKLKLEIHIIEIEKINAGMTLSLAGKEKYNEDLLLNISNNVIEKCY